MATTTKQVIGVKRKFPLLSDTHGSEMATVIVGDGKKQRKFSIHKHLLAQASDYFDRALNGEFATSAGTIKLTHHCPVAFEAVYQWLYSGQEVLISQLTRLLDFPSHYKDTADHHSLIWLRLYRLADETLITDLKLHAYQMLTKTGKGADGGVRTPTVEFVKELFDPDMPQPVLQEYFACVSADTLVYRQARNEKLWSDTWKIWPAYAALVLDRIVTISANRNEGPFVKPWKDQKFSPENVFGLSQSHTGGGNDESSSDVSVD